jgi:hypothetical protein
MGLYGMWLYMFKSQFVSVTKKSGHQGRDYEGGFTIFRACICTLGILGVDQCYWRAPQFPD